MPSSLRSISSAAKSRCWVVLQTPLFAGSDQPRFGDPSDSRGTGGIGRAAWPPPPPRPPRPPCCSWALDAEGRASTNDRAMSDATALLRGIVRGSCKDFPAVAELDG